MELHFLVDIASTVSQKLLLLKLKYFEECYDKISYSIFYVSCRCWRSFVDNIFYVTPQKNHTKLNQETVEIIKYIHTSLSIFHERCYWGIPSQYDKNGVAHYFAATTIFVE